MILRMGAVPVSASAISRGALVTGAGNNQGSMCAQAADARARNSPAFQNVWDNCSRIRAQNIAAGLYYVDAMSPNDPAYRVALERAGDAVIARNPVLAQLRAQIPVDPDGGTQQRRGFTIAQGVRAGKLDPAFPAWVAPALLSPYAIKGFQDAMAAPGASPEPLTQANRPPEDAIDKIPRPVLIGGGLAVAAALGLVAYKLSRRR